MGLRLKQIRLKNWKCYREQKIQFNLNTDKNIWIVFGQNGYGKTSLPLMREFMQEVHDDLQRKNIKKTVLSVSNKQLRELLNSDRCLCGRCMDDQSRDYIRKSLEELAGLENLSQEIIQQNDIQTQLSKLLRDRPFDLDGILLKRDRLVDDLDELQQSIDNIKQDTKGFKRSEVLAVRSTLSAVSRTKSLVRPASSLALS
jgi:DNA repair exonuclease SbcCD ATPase subunit